MASASNIQGPWEVGANDAPTYSGVYIVCAKSWLERPQVLYIGESDNIASRISGHDRREDWEREACGRPLIFFAEHIASRIERWIEERVLIGHFSPPCNVQFTAKARSPSSGGGIKLGALGSLMGVSVKSDRPSALSAFANLAGTRKTERRSPAYGLGSLMGVSVESDRPSALSAFANLAGTRKTERRSPAYGLGSLMGVSVESDLPSAVSALASLCRDNVRNRS